jgi:uncharacterized membrane protein
MVGRFIKFTIIWISQNLAIPFWVVGHVHLSLNVYRDIHEIISSVGMNIIVVAGIIVDYRDKKIDDGERKNDDDDIPTSEQFEYSDSLNTSNTKQRTDNKE